MSGGPSRNWRARAPSHSLYARDWRDRGGRSDGRYSRRVLLRVVGLALAGLLSAIVILLVPWSARTRPLRILGFGIGAYGGRAHPQGNMPINPFGEQDVKAFRALSEERPTEFESVKSEDNALSGGQFLSFLTGEAESPDVSGRNLLVFCTLHAVVEPTGDVRLFAIDATPENAAPTSETLVPLESILSSLRNSRASRVLLALDTSRLQGNWRLGILSNDVPAQILRDFANRGTDDVAASTPAGSTTPAKAPAEPRKPGGTERLTIFLAARPGEQSWTADDGSIFVKSLVEGLSGAADGWISRDGRTFRDEASRDRRVSLQELSNYVPDRVATWVHAHCGAVQTVTVLGNRTDFIVTDVIPAEPASSTPVPRNKAAALKAAKGAAKEGMAKDSNPSDSDSTTAASEPQAGEEGAQGAAGGKGATSQASKGATEGKGSSDGQGTAPVATSTEPARPGGAKAGTERDVGTRLAELWKEHDSRSNTQGLGRDSICRRLPFTWRAFEAALAQSESLRRGGLEDLAPEALARAEQQLKSLQDAASAPAGLGMTPEEPASRMLRALGWGAANAPPLTAAQRAMTGQYLQSLLAAPAAGAGAVAPATSSNTSAAAGSDGSPAGSSAPDASSPPAGESGKPAKGSPGAAVPEPALIEAWFLAELSQAETTADWGRLRQIVAALQARGQWPLTPDCVLMLELLQAAADPDLLLAGPPLRRIFALRQVFRRAAVQAPEALPLLRDDVREGLRALNAAERWLLAGGRRQPEVVEWLDRADRSSEAVGQTSSGYEELVGIWSDLLAEVPAVAAWIATRAADDPARPVDWERLRALAQRGFLNETSGVASAEGLLALWPDRPARLTAVERRALVLMFDARRLKLLLQAHAGSQPGTSPAGGESLAREVLSQQSAVAVHRREMWQEVERAIPRLSPGERPTGEAWREADRLLLQAWLPLTARRRLEAVRRLEPVRDTLGPLQPETSGLWQGFWALGVLHLLAPDESAIAPLWKKWDRLVELTGVADKGSTSERDSLRLRRADLGQAIQQQWNALQSQVASPDSQRGPAEWQLAAAGADPHLLPANHPDLQLRETGKRQFRDWLDLFADQWRGRAFDSERAAPEYTRLAAQAEELAARLNPAAAPRPAVETSPGADLQVSLPNFTAERRGRLEVKTTPPQAGPAWQVLFAAAPVKLVQGDRPISLSQTVSRELPKDGRLEVDLQLDREVDVPSSLLLVLASTDGYPLAFRRVPLRPPFDPKGWRVEYVDAKTGEPVEAVPLPTVAGMKVFLPPAATLTLRADLVRPAKDPTASAKVTLFQVTDEGRVRLADLDVKLPNGAERVPLVFDLPAKSKDKEAAAPASGAQITGPVADIAGGWVFEITPQGQSPLLYPFRPTFWSASRFLEDPRPAIKDEERFVLELRRRPATAADRQLPRQIGVELKLPRELEGQVSDYTLGGPVGFDQRLILSFLLPKDWPELLRDRDATVALDVAGLPHAFRWAIQESGVLPITGRPPRVGIRFVPPLVEGRPVRAEPILVSGKEALRLQFQVDADDLDRTEEAAPWILKFEVLRETPTGFEATPFRRVWRLGSSIERHVDLAGVQAGVWTMTTAARDYEHIVPPLDIGSLLGRFQVQATLARSDRGDPVATSRLRFAIDTEAPPDLALRDLSTDPRPVTQDFRFRIDAADVESGIRRLVWGFDKNGDKQLQEDEERMDVQSFRLFERPQATWMVVVPKNRLPRLEKDRETWQILVQARNGLGVVATRVAPVTFYRPAPPQSATTGNLVVNLSLSRGARSSIQLTGPKAQLVETQEGTYTFSNLPAGQYQIKVKVNYAVVGRQEAGDATVTIEAGRTATASIPLSEAK